MRELRLTQDKVALVDDEDYDRIVAIGKWSARRPHRLGRSWYAQRSSVKTIQLHRFILNVTDPRVWIDHRNGDGLDCQKHNLRIATPAQNGHNRRRLPAGKISAFKGVSWCARSLRWRVTIGANGKYTHAGYFSDEQTAALTYDIYARRLHGAFAVLNFPEEGRSDA